jgi:Asp-tRNA(Asn)/Glu-tRNA(Gln) amidotransferase A subunit family amidase
MKNIYALAIIPLATLFLSAGDGLLPDREPITGGHIRNAEQILGLAFSDAERDSMIDGLENQRVSYQALRRVPLKNETPPAILFNPIPRDLLPDTAQIGLIQSDEGPVDRPHDLEELAFASIGRLGALLRARKVSSVELTGMYLDRLKRYGPQLHCVITLTEELAMEQARKADTELADGVYRGPLHGIPYGAKDLLATRGIRTTWGAVPFREQVFEEDATVVKKLADAGAVLVAKLSLGALAWGDVWFGGKTRNPWNLDQGSSGSSAGSAAATAAGLVGFSIGTETWGSIVSPSNRCGVTGLRPTFGRVSRHGAMALAWSMDKIGPICRTVEDCALVFDAIRGPDGKDQSVLNASFGYSPTVALEDLRIGYLKQDVDSSGNRDNDLATLEALKRLGAELIPLELPRYPIDALSIILSAEAGAAFDELTRSGQDDLLVRQIKNAWPNVFRQSRFIPAVEYIQANRIRTLLIQEMASLMNSVDLYIAPSLEGENLLLTNLTGHPSVVLPNGFNEGGSPASITFIGQLYGEAQLLAVSKTYQDATDFHLQHPPLPE